jgi:AraC-like DNA-binding protein
MKEKAIRQPRPAILFGQKCVKSAGYINDYIFACEIVGGDHIKYSKPRRPKYHLVILVLEGTLRIIINGKEYIFTKNTYVNLPTWADIYEIEYDENFKAMTTATDKTVVEDIFRNRNPLPPDFRMKLNHTYGGNILDEDDIQRLCKDIRNLIEALNDKTHHFAEELCYSYFYILITDMANMMWERYGKGVPAKHTDMRRSESIIKEFVALLQENIETHTDVGFYAEKLCISKQYLSLIVKEKTMVSIGTVISSLRAEIAAGLLRDPDLSIQQIANRLSFSDQSSFGKFFRKHTGMSPLKYRQSLRKTLLTLRPE